MHRAINPFDSISNAIDANLHRHKCYKPEAILENYFGQ